MEVVRFTFKNTSTGVSCTAIFDPQGSISLAKFRNEILRCEKKVGLADKNATVTYLPFNEYLAWNMSGNSVKSYEKTVFWGWGRSSANRDEDKCDVKVTVKRLIRKEVVA